MKKTVLSLFILFISCALFAQTYDGYTLYSVQNSTTAKLIDMAGNTYHTWTFASSKKTGYSTYLRADGSLVRTVAYTGASMGGGGITGEVQIVDWDGNVTWDYIHSSTTYCLHHDICPMPNGNVLMISYEVKTSTQATQAGCSSAMTINSEKIIEVQPTGASTGTIVWEWHLWDHLCQNYNSSKDNYVTSIVQHPELVNINYNTSSDWMHMNGIDYNAELDQITFSSHNLNEIYVIDHSTTTAQAATHTGGNSGKGGDILYRWGNPAAYGASGTTNFNVVHDAHFIPADCPNAGYLSAFNNKGGSGSKSAIDVVNPPRTGYTYSITLGSAFLPSTYTSRITSAYSCNNMGNCQQLPNGNTLMCIPSGSINYLIEYNSSGTVVWSKNISGGTIPQAFRYSACYVNGPPTVVAAASSTTICSGQSVNLTATPSGGTTYTYAWASSPAGFSSTSQNPSVSPTESTTYTVTVTSDGCTGTSTLTVNVVDPPSVTASSELATICAGQSVQLYANTSGSYTYLWSSSPAGFTSTAQNPSATPGETTTYYVTASAGSCSGISEVTVNVAPLPAIAISASDNNICYGEEIQLFSGGTGDCSFFWFTAGGFSSTEQDPYVTPTVSTTYFLDVDNGICISQGEIEITVNSLPGAPSITESSGILSSTPASGYQWYLDGTAIDGATSQTITPVEEGNYQVQIADANGCWSDLSAIFVYTVSSIEMNGFANEVFYPSPTSGILYYNGKTDENNEVCIYNSTGKEVIRKKLSASIDISLYNEGLYFMEIIRKGERVLYQKVVLAR